MDDLCSKPATELAELLRQKKVSAVELARAHLDRIERFDGELRAFTHVFAEEALAAAQRADDERARGEARGPLHGLPVSVKESIDWAGRAATMGVASRRSFVAERDGAMIETLRAAGAVILGRTNVSQYLIFHESRNPIYGQTANTWSRAHTPGGSSGGEAASLAAGTSALGVGADIGGSIRVPAHFSGICGLKPTLDRWTNQGSNTALVGQETVRGQIGPMARTASDCAFFFCAIDPVAMSALDPRVAPLAVRDVSTIDPTKLRVGWYVDDGWVRASRAVRRAVERAAEAMRSIGCEVAPFQPPSTMEAIEGYFGALSADGGETVARGLEGGEVDPVLAALRRVAKIPSALRPAVAATLRALGDALPARILKITHGKSVYELWQITNALRRTRQETLRAMDAARIDVVLCPAHATPALPHGMSKDFPIAGSPSMFWNAVQFPAGVVPVTRVREDEAVRPGARGRWETHAENVDRASVGLPVGVQVVARPWKDEEVLAAMMAIEREVSPDAGHPKTPIDPR
jgi:fatty acid amide hydrolase